jgi:hypothetical protein
LSCWDHDSRGLPQCPGGVLQVLLDPIHAGTLHLRSVLPVGPVGHYLLPSQLVLLVTSPEGGMHAGPVLPNWCHHPPDVFSDIENIDVDLLRNVFHEYERIEEKNRII